jgi:hypothetical protein
MPYIGIDDDCLFAPSCQKMLSRIAAMVQAFDLFRQPGLYRKKCLSPPANRHFSAHAQASATA